MAQNEERKGVLPQIIIAVVVALLAGGTSPWWWEEMFPKNDAIISPNGGSYENPTSPTLPTSVGPIVVTATANPPVITRGEQTTINVYVQDSQGHPLPFAMVTLSSGGGSFNRTGTTKVSGSTDSSGTFRANWSCTYCAPGYVSGVRVTKSGFEEVKTEWRVKIR